MTIYGAWYDSHVRSTRVVFDTILKDKRGLRYSCSVTVSTRTLQLLDTMNYENVSLVGNFETIKYKSFTNSEECEQRRIKD